MSPETSILAVAGDNTKTDVAILEPDGTLRAAVRGPGASPDLLGLDVALERLGESIDRGWREAKVDAAEARRAAVGMYFLAGVDTPDDERRVSEGIASRRWSLRSQVANDVFATLWAATGTGEGVAIYVGSGINCVGRLSSGAVARFAALGPVSGDWGDGESLGLGALAAAVRGEDGRTKPTRLTRTVCAYFHMATATQVALAVHRGEIDQERLLELVPLVLFSAAIHDPAAEQLLDRQADEVVRYALGASRQLRIGDRPFDVVLSGSLVADELSLTVVRIRRRLATALPRARAVLCTTLPVAGAAIAGLASVSAGEVARKRLRATLVPDRLEAMRGMAFINQPGQ